MPGFYQAGEYDVSGTIVGVVEKSRMLDGSTIRAGDAIIGIESSGLHTNGYSLARTILFDDLKLDPKTRLPELKNSIGAELLKVHISYGPLVQRLLKRFNKAGKRPIIKGLAHITGGGFVDNIPRVLPSRCDAIIRKGTWRVLPIFELLGKRGNVPEQELYQVFNMGIGMAVFVPKQQSKVVLSAISGQGLKAWIIGSVEEGNGVARVI
jgi:phosphoribosylformylglycinamidine cyclo-ligase